MIKYNFVEKERKKSIQQRQDNNLKDIMIGHKQMFMTFLFIAQVFLL
ncbi:hypothetical protein SDC9_101039 [bioreactor metagenome]|uniref:Uncharacterized protein n=1 Tax=bioreactor metagenome TaxID=1076179 RepID=A0A645ATP1_9ZZZZ